MTNCFVCDDGYFNCVDREPRGNQRCPVVVDNGADAWPIGDEDAGLYEARHSRDYS
ncbi:hypothetical protein [Streptomyces lavendulae]|uniref:hypothetical protein n=1 Tax=Streptomyces lavendulae TaxID=1914 RepID=UPI0033C5D39B